MLGISHGVTAKLCKCATPHRIFATRVFPNQLQAIVGLILVKELLMVDEDAGVHIRDLRLRELPFMR